MTARTNPAPLPVVACWMWPYSANSGHAVSEINPELGKEHSAVAVPWALLEDEAFQVACATRFFKEKLVNGVGMKAALTAITAELRARAGGAA